ncbi:MAG: hypothetical protein JRN67_05955 [Nitrososphaerota archaeon]|nr:hypothetical protein [Nitrososphaerota archaeon]
MFGADAIFTEPNGDKIGVEIFFQDRRKIIQIGSEMVRLSELVKFIEGSP